MKIKIILAGLLISSPACIAQETEFPPIKPGLWSMVSIGQGRQTKSKFCVNENTARELFTAGQKMFNGQCSEVSMEKKGNQYISRASCNLIGTSAQLQSILQGDFSKEYTSKSTVVFNSPMGQTNNNSEEKATYVGACSPGMQPGDIILENGEKMNSKEVLQKGAQLGKIMQNMEAGLLPNPEELKQMLEQLQIGTQ